MVQSLATLSHAMAARQGYFMGERLPR